MWMRFALTTAVVAAAWAPGLAGQAGSPGASQAAQRTNIDVSRLGPQVGEEVPDFSLPDQNGRTWTRQSIMGPRGAMLVFVRSADW
jgi:hypothetical protein